METKQNDDVLTTTSFCLSEEALEQVRETSRRVGMNARIQCTDGQVLGVGIFIDATVVEQFTEADAQRPNSTRWLCRVEYYWRSREVRDTTIWDDIVPVYVSFCDGPVVATFESNEPNRTITNQYQQQQHDFIEMLKERLPLAGKTLKITRTALALWCFLRKLLDWL